MSLPNQFAIQSAAGSFKGSLSGGVMGFHSIPYAKPPVGDLRFRPPERMAPQTGERDCTRPGPISLQTPSRLSNVNGHFEHAQSEDCLTLSVWTPRADDAKRPVVIWLHGGAYATGGASLDWHDGSRLASEGDVVVVGVNYRVGALGFLCLEGVSPGNLGVMDQELAIQWVADNISAFGGDPAQITLMGQSAGALTIALLLARPQVPPVRRAILMSAPLGMPLCTPETARHIGEAYLRALDIAPQDADAAERVRAVPASKLLPAATAAARHFATSLVPPGDATPPYLPVADGSYLPSAETLASRLKAAAGVVDVMVGTTANEDTPFYPGGNRPFAATLFNGPSVEWCRHASSAGRQAYRYSFDWSPEASPFGAPHCIELPFVFGSFDAFRHAPMLAGGDREEMETLAREVRTLWLSFIKTGVPRSPQVPNWPPCAPSGEPCLHLNSPVAHF